MRTSKKFYWIERVCASALDGWVTRSNLPLLMDMDPAEYTGKKVLAVPRCCQKRKGTQDCERVNGSVAKRVREMKET